MAVTAANTVGDALGAATDAIAAAGVETARLDAEVLLAEATGWDRARITASPALRLPVGASREFAAMVRRRVRREPVAYILGRKGFRRIELLLDRHVLIPRPETELLVEEAISLCGGARPEPVEILDVGTGSGAIALALADELPGARVTGIDTSLEALRVAQANAERLGLADQVDFVAGGVSSIPPGEYGLLVANLPYVGEGEWEELDPEIREYEPREALVAGEDGLAIVTELLQTVAALARRPMIALEIGAGQADQVSALARGAGYSKVEVRRDLAGHDRVIVGR
jgi:release factor glutamine methyltransferase